METFDFNAFLRRKKLTHKTAAALIGVSQGLVSSWAAHRAVPSYESMISLIKAGITAEELLGPELARMLRVNGGSAEDVKELSRDDIKSAVQSVLADLFSDAAGKSGL